MLEGPSSGRSVLITGAAGGLGQGMVRSFSNAGWRVAAGIHRTPLPPEFDADTLVSLDVRSTELIQKAAVFLMERYGGLDCLLVNAGALSDSLLPRMDEASWDAVMDVHLNGARLCAQHFLPLLVKRSGHLIFISSFVAKAGAIGQSNYAAAKAGMVGLAQSIAREHGAAGVRSNLVFPGLLPTGMTVGLTSGQWAALESANVLNRTNTIGEVSEFVTHLAGMQGVSGQVFQLDSRISRWC